MHNLREYLRAYRGYVSTSLGLGKTLLGAVLWLAGMFAPLAAKTIVFVPLASAGPSSGEVSRSYRRL